MKTKGGGEGTVSLLLGGLQGSSLSLVVPALPRSSGCRAQPGGPRWEEPGLRSLLLGNSHRPGPRHRDVSRFPLRSPTWNTKVPRPLCVSKISAVSHRCRLSTEGTREHSVTPHCLMQASAMHLRGRSSTFCPDILLALVLRHDLHGH